MHSNKEKLENLKKMVLRCKKCELWKYRNKVVFGDGNANAKIMLIGEAPGRKEDEKGKPFVGAAGKLLDELLDAARVKRDEVYITNVVKCRPPKNREPNKEEIKACTPYLDEQIRIINPNIIVTLGRVATSYIFQKFGLKEIKISEAHGKVFKVSKARLVAMYHPAAALRNPRLKEVLKKDWKKLTLTK